MRIDRRSGGDEKPARAAARPKAKRIFMKRTA
jgi:hypothetical protein